MKYVIANPRLSILLPILFLYFILPKVERLEINFVINRKITDRHMTASD